MAEALAGAPTPTGEGVIGEALGRIEEIEEAVANTRLVVLNMPASAEDDPKLDHLYLRSILWSDGRDNVHRPSDNRTDVGETFIVQYDYDPAGYTQFLSRYNPDMNSTTVTSGLQGLARYREQFDQTAEIAGIRSTPTFRDMMRISRRDGARSPSLTVTYAQE